MEKLIVHGLYKVADQYFSDFQGHWYDNKNENRPYYYLLEDTDGVSWVIPMSTQVENYKKKIEKIEEKRGPGNCLYYHIGVVAGVERVFLIGDMFPINSSYIKAPFIIGHHHYISRNKTLNFAIRTKAIKYLKLVEQGVINSRNDIMSIKQTLIEQI